MAWLLPFEQFSITSPHLLPVAVKILAEHVEKQRFRGFWSSKDHLFFEGVVDGRGFQIHRIIHHQNSFLPMIRGRFFQLSEGVRIDIFMRPHLLVLIFLLGWCTPLVYALFNHQFEGLMCLFPIGMLVFAWGLCAVCFHLEAEKARQRLQSIFATGDASAATNS